MKKISSKKISKWEKIFIGFNLVFILIVFIVYFSRLVYYYKIEHPKEEDNSLVSHITKLGTVLSGDGLYTFDEKEYFYKGINVNNYLWYSGRLFRIMEINEDGIKLITEDNQTSLANYNLVNYEDSYLNIWLNSFSDIENSGIFINSINNYNQELVKFSTCVDSIDLNNIECLSKYDDYSSLLSISEYLRAGGVDSYLNNGTYFWTSNSNSDGLPYYIFETGGINYNEGNFSYGVRPVITIRRYVDYVSGDGTKDNPYIISNRNISNIKDSYIGEYIKLGNYVYRIQDNEEEYVKLILDGYLSDSIKKNYKSNIIDYLNNNFYKELDKKYLGKCNFINGTYGIVNDYDYTKTFNSKITLSIGIPSIGELFITDYDNYWLYNSYNNSNSLNYKTSSLGRIIGDEILQENYIRPVLCVNNDININGGNGTKNNPFEVGE